MVHISRQPRPWKRNRIDHDLSKKDEAGKCYIWRFLVLLITKCERRFTAALSCPPQRRSRIMFIRCRNQSQLLRQWAQGSDQIQGGASAQQCLCTSTSALEVRHPNGTKNHSICSTRRYRSSCFPHRGWLPTVRVMEWGVAFQHLSHLGPSTRQVSSSEV